MNKNKYSNKSRDSKEQKDLLNKKRKIEENLKKIK